MYVCMCCAPSIQLDAERMAVMEMRQRMSLLQKSLEEEKSSAAAAQQEKTRQRDHSVVQVERKVVISLDTCPQTFMNN